MLHYNLNGLSENFRKRSILIIGGAFKLVQSASKYNLYPIISWYINSLAEH